MGAAGEEKVKAMIGTVDWSDADKLKERFDKWNDTPTTLQVMLAQEDVWVYKALLTVVHNTNDMGPDPKHDPARYVTPASRKQARIKEIQALDIGGDAVQSWAASENSVVVYPADSGPGKSNAPAAPAPAPAPATAPPPSANRGQAQYLGASSGPGTSLLAGRYVNNNGKPLVNPSKQPNDEFRMMPIDLRVIIEQKEIPRLLVECANSKHAHRRRPRCGFWPRRRRRSASEGARRLQASHL